jgi:hypothetical protein
MSKRSRKSRGAVKGKIRKTESARGENDESAAVKKGKGGIYSPPRRRFAYPPNNKPPRVTRVGETVNSHRLSRTVISPQRESPSLFISAHKKTIIIKTVLPSARGEGYKTLLTMKVHVHTMHTFSAGIQNRFRQERRSKGGASYHTTWFARSRPKLLSHPCP